MSNPRIRIEPKDVERILEGLAELQSHFNNCYDITQLTDEEYEAVGKEDMAISKLINRLKKYKEKV